MSVRYSFSSQPQSGGNDVVLIMETFDNACSSPAWTRVASPIVLSRQLHNTLQRDEKGRPVIHNLVQCKRSQNCEFDSKSTYTCTLDDEKWCASKTKDACTRSPDCILAPQPSKNSSLCMSVRAVKRDDNAENIAASIMNEQDCNKIGYTFYGGGCVTNPQTSRRCFPPSFVCRSSTSNVRDWEEPV